MERPKATKGETRRAIRQVLEAAGGYGVTREKLKREVDALSDPEEVSEDLFRDSLEFCYEENWVRRERDHVNEVWRYYITADGMAAGKVR